MRRRAASAPTASPRRWPRPRRLHPPAPRAARPRACMPRARAARLGADLARVGSGGLETLLDAPAASGDAPSDSDTVQRSLPRWFRANEPAVVVQGCKRSLKHGGDGRFSHDGTLVCRLGGFFVTALSAAVGAAGERATVTAADLLERPFDGRGTPPECGDLLGETVLLDPGSGRSAALHVIPEPAEEIVQAFMVEQTVWWALRDPLVDPTALLAHSGLAGTLPSPLAITPPAAAWAPRHLDWTVEVFPSPRGAADWTLGEIDMGPDESAIPDATPGAGITISGRSLLTGGIAQAAASAGRAAIDVGALAGSAGVVPGDSNIFVPAFARATLGRLTAAADGGGASRGDADDRGSPRRRPAQHGRARGDARGRARDAARRAARPGGGNRRSTCARAGSGRHRCRSREPCDRPACGSSTPSARSSTCSDPARAARPTRRAPPRRAR